MASPSPSSSDRSDGAAWPYGGSKAVLPQGTLVAHLRLEQVVHEGPTAIVYRTTDALAEGPAEPIALMEYFPRLRVVRGEDGEMLPRYPDDAAVVERARAAFVADADALRRVQSPFLVRVHGTLAAHHTVYRAMGFVEGPTLERQVRLRTSAPPAVALLGLFDGLLQALQALHDAGIAHGRIRPAQILLEQGRLEHPVLLGPGGAATALASRGPVVPALPGDPVDIEADLYALAQCVWFAVTGVVPPTLQQQLTWPAPWDPADGLAGLLQGGAEGSPAQSLVRTLVAALDMRSAQRPRSAAECRQRLHGGPNVPVPATEAGLADGVTAPRPAAPTLERPRWSESDPQTAASEPATALRRPIAARPRPRLRTAIAAIWLCSLALLGSAWLWMGSPFKPTLTAPEGFGEAPAPAALPPPRAGAAPPAGAREPQPALAATPADTAALPPREARKATGRATPLSLCENRTQFSRLRCLQEQCRRQAWRNHAQCRELRSRGEIE